MKIPATHPSGASCAPVALPLLVLWLLLGGCAGPPRIGECDPWYETESDLELKAHVHREHTQSLVNDSGLLLYRSYLPWGAEGEMRRNHLDSHDIATRSNNKISKELLPIASHLKKKFKYTGFQLVKTSSGAADLKETHVARLSLGYSARVTPLAVSGNRIQLAVEVKRLLKKRVNAKIGIDKGGMQLFGGWDYPGAKDDVMIVGVRAR